MTFDVLPAALIVVITVCIGVMGYLGGWSRGRNAGRLEVLADWWSADHPEPEEPEDSLAWLLDIDPGTAQPPTGGGEHPSAPPPKTRTQRVVGG